MADKIEIINEAVLQHGIINDRVYIMKTGRKNISYLIKAADKLAAENGYSKIFAKVRSENERDFLKEGYSEEARVKGYFNGKKDALFMAKYFSDQRRVLKNKEEIESVIRTAVLKSSVFSKRPAINCEILKCSKKHSRAMAELYKSVFKTYPFAIYDPEYIEETMEENIIYFGAFKNGELIALSSCETDKESQSVEMTDFATSAKHAGNGTALELLKEMEKNMRENGFITAYTIARSVSVPMNVTFARAGYLYSGTLINNTNICGSIESMNVWTKKL